jgi:putative ubiquitin-RnfH superfamily antitoxin RatB of RatAB toxin-antitoxin module
MKVTVAYATATAQHVLVVDLAADATVADAVNASGLLMLEPDVQLESARIGIWNRLCRADTRLHDGDRVEIYRPLLVDPKEARRVRAELRKKR